MASFYAGSVDEVQVYGVALSNKAIDFLFSHPGSSLPSGMAN